MEEGFIGKYGSRGSLVCISRRFIVRVKEMNKNLEKKIMSWPRLLSLKE